MSDPIEDTRWSRLLGTVADSGRDDSEGFWQFNAPPFDELQRNQKLALLARTVVALLREDEPVPKPTDIVEGAAHVLQLLCLFGSRGVTRDHGGRYSCEPFFLRRLSPW